MGRIKGGRKILFGIGTLARFRENVAPFNWARAFMELI